MSYKAFLCSIDGTFNFPLLPKVTTIGRENCDIVINSPNIDSQHAVIEFIDTENNFVIQDLNTVNGTYINDCRVQNAAVRLAEQDIIRFGFNGIPFQFLIQEQQLTSIPPINLSKTSCHSQNQLQLINQTIPCRGSYTTNNANSSGIWINIPATNAQLLTMNNPTTTTSIIKPPATLRARPTSACAVKKVTRDFGSPQLNGWVKGQQTNSNLQFNMNSDIEVKSINNESELHNKLYQLEKEMKIKNNEIKDLTEKLNSLQSQQNSITGASKTQEVTLKNELEQVKRDKSIATGLINTMQKDLTTKDATISKLAREIENFKKEIRDKDAYNRDISERLNSMKDSKKTEEERQNKEKELLVLKNKIKTTEGKVVDLNNQVLHIKAELEESQRVNMKYTQNEKNLKDELEHVKIQYMDMQRAERTVRIDLEQSRRMYEKFRNLIIQTLFSTPGISHPAGEVTDDDLISTWKRLIEERTKLKEKITSLEEDIKNEEEQHFETIESIKILDGQLSNIKSNLFTSSGRKSNELLESIDNFTNTKLEENLTKLKDSIIEIIQINLKCQTDIEDSLKLLDIDVNNNFALSVLIKSIEDKLKILQEQKIEIQKKFDDAEIEHSLHIENLTREKLNETENLLESLRKELNEKHSIEINNLIQENEEKLKSIQSTSQLSQDEICIELTNVKSQLNEANAELITLKESLEAANSSINALNILITDKEEEYKTKINEIEIQKHEAAAHYSQDLEIYKEQIRQHSLTIVSLEKDVNRTREREIDLLNQIDKLKKQIEIQKEQPIKKPTPPPTPPKIDSDVLLLEKTIDNLRNECLIYNKKITEQDEIIKVLRRDLINATAKLTDVQGEMTDKQKRELEKNRAIIHDQTRELAENRNQLAKLSEIVDSQTSQINTLKNDLNKSKALIDKYKSSAEENGNLVLELKSKLDNGQMQLKKIETIRHEEGKITSELTAVGAQCRGERHEQVITRQREALNELRQRVKTLEQSRPALPAAQQQMQQQIMLLKKELAEFRANQALTEDIAKQASLTRGNDDNLLMLEEKTAHFDTRSALDYSEETYLNLLRSIASMLELNEVNGLRSMTHLPNDERERLLIERNRSIEIICIKIKELKESLVRKEKLLQEYELDLAKLRQTEFLLQKKSEQLEETQLSSRNKDDEIQLLKESLKNSRIQIDNEKILNSSIKQKKLNSASINFDRIRKNSTEHLHHHCPPDAEGKVRDVKKSMSEKIKKKDYELKVLKQELRSKYDELSEISNKLKIHENGQDLYN